MQISRSVSHPVFWPSLPFALADAPPSSGSSPSLNVCGGAQCSGSLARGNFTGEAKRKPPCDPEPKFMIQIRGLRSHDLARVDSRQEAGESTLRGSQGTGIHLGQTPPQEPTLPTRPSFLIDEAAGPGPSPFRQLSLANSASTGGGSEATNSASGPRLLALVHVRRQATNRHHRSRDHHPPASDSGAGADIVRREFR